MVFPTFFYFSLNLAIRSSWSEPQSAPILAFADCIEHLHLWLQRYNKSDFSIDHLVMSICWVFSCVVGRGYLLWTVCSLGKTLIVFALLHSVIQGQICPLLQIFLDFLLLHFFPGGSEDKASACNAGDLGSIPGLRRSPGEGNGNPLLYSCLENPIDRGA